MREAVAVSVLLSALLCLFPLQAGVLLGEANSSIQVMLWTLVNVKGLNHKCGDLGSYLNHGYAEKCTERCGGSRDPRKGSHW